MRALAFITGCGRSGTTILGRILATHPHVMYLCDRFDLWVRPFPVADIWSESARALRADARIALTAADATPAGCNQFRRLLERERRGRRVLVEKLPINNFRLPFLAALCPEAQLIGIVRHGVEVARSIERKAAAGEWYGERDRKWRLLEAHARQHGYGTLLERCTTPFLRGLLEWRMSVDAAQAYATARPGARRLTVRYEELVRSPVRVARAMLTFLGLDPSEDVDRFAAEHVRRLTPAADAETPPGTEEIAGDLLRSLGYWPEP